MKCLHYVFIPRINAQLSQFASAWNSQPIHTENDLSPLQLWMRGLLSAEPNHQAEILDGMTVNDDYGVSSDYAYGFTSTDSEGVVVPAIDVDLTQQQLDYIQQNFHPLYRSDLNGESEIT